MQSTARMVKLGVPALLAAALVTTIAAFAIMSGLGAPATALAQTGTPQPTPYIAVTGEGRVFVDPDLAVASIGVDITASSLTTATQLANTTMTAVIDAIKAQGVDAKDIQTSSYNIYPITNQSQEGATPEITGYHVSNIVTIKVRQLDKLGAVLDTALGAGANSINSVYFTVDDPTAARNQARTLAVKAAMAQAQTLADAAGVKVGKIIAISDVPGGVTPVFRDSFAVPAAGGGAGPVETGQTEITANVELRFEITQ